MSTMRISQSVGLGGQNAPADIKAVQVALNKMLGQLAPTKKLTEDGRLGSRPENSKTVAAIKLFQSKVVRMIRPDGKIDANGRSHKKMNEQLSKFIAIAAVAISGSLKTTLKQNIEKYEGKIPHMYLDTKGFVTIGTGHLLKDAEAAKKVPFVVRDTGVAATTKQIEDEFSLIKARPFGDREAANKFKAFTQLIITSGTMDYQVEKHIVSFESELKRIYGGVEFSAFPDSVKLALFDMIFNLGMTKLSNLFTNFNKYIKSGDYNKAALECSRTGISDARNLYVKSLLSTSK